MATILITGCGSGFGKLSAVELARRGHRVFASCRTLAAADQLGAETAGRDGIVPLALDVTDQASVDAAMRRIGDAAGAIDVLVNNAGIARLGALEDLDADALRGVMETNFFGALRVTRAVLAGMRTQGEGRIIMVSSLSALVGLPGEGIYAASKAALEAAAESLRYEVDRFGIHVSVVEPGAFDTAMPAKLAAGDAVPAASPYRPLLSYLTARAQRQLGTGDDPQRVATLIADIAETDEPGFRYAAGRQAEQVVQRLRALDESARADFIRGVNDTQWWSAGADRPE
ncbi:MAG: SDR family oxidoreductase [Chromatiales bacterium]|nr:MAG: SDR family oxidoreductase [Chromatiales bacterium]